MLRASHCMVPSSLKEAVEKVISEIVTDSK